MWDVFHEIGLEMEYIISAHILLASSGSHDPT
jgi:hypothetical protein